MFLDGSKVGEIVFPTGDVDLTSVWRPWATQRLDLLVVAMPLRGVMLSYSDTALVKEVRATVARSGLSGDVALVSPPRDPASTK